jgi:hypothetical protein
MPHQRQRHSDRLLQSTLFLVCRSALPSCYSAFAKCVHRHGWQGTDCCWRSVGRQYARDWERRLGRIRLCKSTTRSATENIIPDFLETHLNNRRAFSLFLDQRSRILDWMYRQRIYGRIRAFVFSWRRRQNDNVLIGQDSAVRENQAFAVDARILLPLAELASHLGQGMHAVVIAGTAKRSEAAEKSERRRWQEQ